MDGPTLASALIGTEIGGKYRVERLLGRGGMGEVVEALNLAHRGKVALKFLRSRRPDSVARFLREARAAARLKSEHVVRVLDVGQLAGGEPFLVMELLSGRDLGAEISRRGALPVGEAVDYALQACEGLAEAHAAGIIHRDLKPDNLFLEALPGGREARVKVLDFGVAKAAGDGDEQALTATSQAIGSPMYMAPEQMRDARSVDERADVWSLGVVLYQMLSGATPFEAPTVQALCADVLTSDPAPLGRRSPGLPAGLCEAVMRCLERSPGRRFRSVGELARALAPHGGPPCAARLSRVEAIEQARPVPLPPPCDEPAQPTIDPLEQPRPLGGPAPSSRGELAAPPPQGARGEPALSPRGDPGAPAPGRAAAWGLALALVGGLAGALILRAGSGAPASLAPPSSPPKVAPAPGSSAALEAAGQAALEAPGAPREVASSAAPAASAQRARLVVGSSTGARPASSSAPAAASSPAPATSASPRDRTVESRR